MKQTIVIAGLGLIGGSLAKGISNSSENYIIGYDTNRHSLEYALANKVIDQSETNLERAAKEADIIILATPISETIDLMRRLNDVSFTKDVIISDVSSVKGSIIECANKFTNTQITFIGGHPMAGSHKNGIYAAKEHLFENAIYVLIPPNNCAKEKIDQLKHVLKRTKSHFIVLQPKEHDEMTGVISHFPHLIASSLVHQARKWQDKHAYLPELAAGGFRDITRIASSNPKMWKDIFYHNQAKLSELLKEWINEMTSLKDILDNNSSDEMMNYLSQAKEYRDGLGREKIKGAIPSYYDLYVDIEDEPGALASVVQLLATKEISISNIRILEIREGINGALRLTVTNKEAQNQAVQLLEENEYEVKLAN